MPRKKSTVEAETTPETVAATPVEEKAVKKAGSLLKKAAPKKTAEKAEAVEKTPAKKAPSILKKEKVEEVYLQAGGNEWNVSACKEKAVEAYVAQGHRASSVKKLVVYLKPEEGKAYYVVNDDVNGCVDL